ncbi:MAG TPA: type II toxin-antitoxin system VapC family toxin [Solirubrobacteraceae bacterium]|nr:type II toxin-antitoxin system VapC family toxin [Solirubrobacteraceae bacterium]
MAVLDASVLVEYLVGLERRQAVRTHILADAGALWAPHLVDAEVGHVLRRAVDRGYVTPAAAGEALVDLARFPLRRAAHVGLLERAWQLRDNVSFYDALYVALAERLDEPLLTLDARLATAPGVSAEVLVIG